jgi:multicomponent K+:H+ antiporter subunit F
MPAPGAVVRSAWGAPMSLLAAVLPWAIAGFAVALLLNAWRLLRGPGVADRILALDTLYINSLALLVLLGLHFGTDLYFEAALLIAMLGFIGTVVLSKYLLRGDIVE